MGIEPTTSGLDLPLLCRLSYEAEQRAPGTIMVVNRGKKVRVHMIPFTRANAQWVIHGSMSTLIYTSELILCSTICVHSATRHNIHMYPYFLFAAIHHHNRVRPSSSVGRVTVDLIRRSWVRFPPRSKDFSLPREVP